jgi:hypothetical protein
VLGWLQPGLTPVDTSCSKAAGFDHMSFCHLPGEEQTPSHLCPDCLNLWRCFYLSVMDSGTVCVTHKRCKHVFSVFLLLSEESEVFVSSSFPRTESLRTEVLIFSL